MGRTIKEIWMASEDIVVMDVGHGNCTVIRDEHVTAVIDAGPKNALLEYVTCENISHLDVVLISHADADHIAGLIGLLSSSAVTVGHIRLNTDSLKGSKIWDDLLIILDDLDRANKVDFQVCLVAGTGEEFGCGGIRLQIIAPSKYLAAKGPGSVDKKARKITSNTVSAVIRLVKNDVPILLLPGDLDIVGLNNIIEDDMTISAATMVFPHHGGRPGDGDSEKFATDLINRVTPSNVIFSIGRGKYKTPKPEIISRIIHEASETRFLCTQLSEHCSSELPVDNPSHIGAFYSAGNEAKKCCGGSIKINPDNGNIEHPTVAQHGEFLESCVANAICRGRGAI